MDMVVARSGIGKIGNFRFKCCLGRRGVAYEKSEGDHKTPIGTFP